jgi:hypothetical protein
MQENFIAPAVKTEIKDLFEVLVRRYDENPFDFIRHF